MTSASPSSPSIARESQKVIDALPHIVWLHDDQGRTSFFNRRWVDYTGATAEETVARGADSFVHPDDREALVKMIASSRETGQPFETPYRLRRADGEYRWHVARVVPLERDGQRVTLWVGTATDVEDRQRLEDEQRFLLESAAILGTSLDLDSTLAEVARIVVPRLADWCAIDLLDAKGGVQRAAVAHIDPGKVSLAHDLWKRLPPRPEDPGGFYGVVRTGEPEMYPTITDETLAALIAEPDLLAIYRSLGLRSSMQVPLLARGQVLGTLTFVSAESGRSYDQRSLSFACELGRRIAIAVDNAQLYRAATQARAAAEAMADDVLAQSREAQAALLAMRRERDEARAKSGGGQS